MYPFLRSYRPLLQIPMTKRELAFLGLLLVLACFVYTTNIDSAFLQHMESQGTLYGQLAKNFLTYGYYYV